MNSKSGFEATRSVLLGVSVILASATGCHGVKKRVTPETKWAPFVELSRQGVCSDIRNRLFVIDQALVFADRTGNCPDASYSEVLYGKTVDDVLCSMRDSIAGPRKTCKDPSYERLFDTIIAHLDEPDLGLGPHHTVQRWPL